MTDRRRNPDDGERQLLLVVVVDVADDDVGLLRGLAVLAAVLLKVLVDVFALERRVNASRLLREVF